MKPAEFRAEVHEDVIHAKIDNGEMAYALADLWEAAIEMRAYRMRSVPGEAEQRVHEALRKLEEL